MSVRAIHGDCRDVIPQLVAEGIVVDSVVCDPPYHLLPTVKRFGAENATPPKSVMQENRETRPNQYGRLVKGFMGQQWDGGDIAFRPETWATVATIMRPGAFLVAFGGTRTYHRLACAIEDAGFVIQDCLMWLFATGFPKRRDMLKPAYEPIVLAYKPGGKRTMQIDECRVGAEVRVNPPATNTNNRVALHNGWRDDAEPTIAVGRWPANLVLEDCDEVVGMFPQRKTTWISPDHANNRSGEFLSELSHPGAQGFNDDGSAARFFFSAKAGKDDRWGSRHPTVKPVELMKWLVQLVTPPGGTCLDPFAGSGTTGVAALGAGRNAILIEREEQYYKDIRERLAFYEGGGLHSTQAKARNRKVDHGPLFAETGE